MRRPLLFGCICLFVSIALFVQLTNPPPWTGDYTGWEGEKILLVGQVYQKEYRVSYGEEILVLYLKSILYSEEASTSYLQIKQASKKLSDINPAENVICELNMRELPEGSDIPKLGSEVFLRGEWQGIDHATNPGEFDAANYYIIEGICSRLRNVELLGVGEEQWTVREALYQLRQYLLKNLYTAFPEKEASILAKMLLGDGSGLDNDIQELYQNNGIVHILSISGLHITMLGMGLYKGIRRCGCHMWLAAVLGGVFILMYGIMTGFSVSASRAIGMYLIRMLGEIWGRTYDMLTAMGALAIVILFDNALLVYHSGFLLSFASVCGVGLLAPLLQFPKEWFRKRPGEHNVVSRLKKVLENVGRGLSVSVAVTLFTLPLQLFFFYKVPIYSILINLFIIPFMSTVMVVGLLVMIVPVLSLLSPIEVLIFQWFEWLCHAFERLPGHTWVTGRPEMWQILTYYVILIGMILAGKRVNNAARVIVLVCMICLVGYKLPQPLQITVLDVGQGDCICVQTSEGRCFLFDGGSSSRQNVGEKVILPFLLYQGIDHIDAIFLSHPDTDHYNGILELLENGDISIDMLYLPDVGTDSRKEFELLLTYADKINVQYVSKGDSWRLGDISLTCVHPPKGYESESNVYSACYLLEEGAFSMLFAGDVEGQGEELLTEELKKRGVREVDVLKVAHHGSKYSTTEEFLEVLNMKLAVISCGRKNSYGHPHAETLERLDDAGSKVLITSEYGAIMIKSAPEIQIRFWMAPNHGKNIKTKGFL